MYLLAFLNLNLNIYAKLGDKKMFDKKNNYGKINLFFNCVSASAPFFFFFFFFQLLLGNLDW